MCKKRHTRWHLDPHLGPMSGSTCHILHLGPVSGSTPGSRVWIHIHALHLGWVHVVRVHLDPPSTSQTAGHSTCMTHTCIERTYTARAACTHTARAACTHTQHVQHARIHSTCSMHAYTAHAACTHTPKTWEITSSNLTGCLWPQATKHVRLGGLEVITSLRHHVPGRQAALLHTPSSLTNTPIHICAHTHTHSCALAHIQTPTHPHMPTHAGARRPGRPLRRRHVPRLTGTATAHLPPRQPPPARPPLSPGTRAAAWALLQPAAWPPPLLPPLPPAPCSSSSSRSSCTRLGARATTATPLAPPRGPRRYSRRTTHSKALQPPGAAGGTAPASHPCPTWVSAAPGPTCRALQPRALQPPGEADGTAPGPTWPPGAAGEVAGASRSHRTSSSRPTACSGPRPLLLPGPPQAARTLFPLAAAAAWSARPPSGTSSRS